MFFKGRAKGTTFMLVILEDSYFAHIVISLSYFFQNTNVWIIVVFIHEKTEAPTQNIQALSKFKRHKDTTRVMHTLKCLVFMFYVVTLDYFLPGRSDPKQKVEG